MEELQKSHVLKVEDLSRKKLTEDFEAVTSFFQGSNVKTVYNFGDNDAKYPDAEIDDVHTRNSLASHCTFRSEKQARACCRFITHKEKACFNVHSQFLASTEQPVDWMSQKCKSNQEFDNCQIRIIFGKTREPLLAQTNSFSISGNWAYSNRVCTVQTRTSSTSRRIGRSGVTSEHSSRTHGDFETRS